MEIAYCVLDNFTLDELKDVIRECVLDLDVEAIESREEAVALLKANSIR